MPARCIRTTLLADERLPMPDENWGWGAGYQETAEFEILSTYLSAAWRIPRRSIRTIELRRYNRHSPIWLLELTNGQEIELPV